MFDSPPPDFTTFTAVMKSLEKWQADVLAKHDLPEDELKRIILGVLVGHLVWMVAGDRKAADVLQRRLYALLHEFSD